MTDHDTQARPPSDLIRPLERVLRTLHANPFPDVANPPEVKKRASVAVILRVQPHYSHWPPRHAPDESFIDVAHAGSAEQRATAFFDQDWVKHGEPEVLFIRRAAREGDRWQSHVALPGGRRDPEDEGDKAAAIRETAEEVGIDLSDANCIAIGNLPQRVVTTSWGKVALMVLCPYVFLITQPSLPPLRLQPTEVASTHWVSLRALLSPSQRTFAYEDVSSRLAKQEKGWRKDVMRVMLGKMQFAAIRLIPSESSYCSTTPGFLPPAPQPDIRAAIMTRLGVQEHTIVPAPSDKPLLLWGLTLGIMADFLDMLPPHNALHLWTYPTFTDTSTRLMVWAMSYRFRRQKLRETTLVPDNTDPLLDARHPPTSPPPQVRAIRGEGSPGEVGIGGLGIGIAKYYYGQPGAQFGAVGHMLHGYYDLVRRAVYATVGLKLLLLYPVALYHLGRRVLAPASAGGLAGTAQVPRERLLALAALAYGLWNAPRYSWRVRDVACYKVFAALMDGALGLPLVHDAWAAIAG